jgi:hypothetical protein
VKPECDDKKIINSSARKEYPVRIATMTNWAYGITVALTLASGIAMLMASSADNAERRAVEQRQAFDQLSEEVKAAPGSFPISRDFTSFKKSGCAAGVPAASPGHRRH